MKKFYSLYFNNGRYSLFPQENEDKSVSSESGLIFILEAEYRVFPAIVPSYDLFGKFHPCLFIIDSLLLGNREVPGNTLPHRRPESYHVFAAHFRIWYASYHKKYLSESFCKDNTKQCSVQCICVCFRFFSIFPPPAISRRQFELLKNPPTSPLISK